MLLQVPTVTNLKCYDLLALCNLSFLLISWVVNNYYFTCINLGYHLHNLSKTVSKKHIIHATHTQCSRYMYILPSLINLTPLSNLNLHVHWFREGGAVMWPTIVTRENIPQKRIILVSEYMYLFLFHAENRYYMFVTIQKVLKQVYDICPVLYRYTCTCTFIRFG